MKFRRLMIYPQVFQCPHGEDWPKSLFSRMLFINTGHLSMLVFLFIKKKKNSAGDGTQ